MKSFTIVKYKYKLRKGCERVKNQDTNNEQKKLYDATCKQVLSEKSLIAYILQTCLDEFRGYSLRYIVRHCIQGTPDVGTVVVEADNGGSFRIKNQQTEDKTETEGTVFYDIRFTAIVPNNGKLIELIINIEAQNDFNPGYPLLKRAVYYCSRMISSQYGSVFTKSHYEKIQKVYSIWICTNPTQEWSYSITRYKMQEYNLVGASHAPQTDYDLLTPILVCLGQKKYTELHGLLKMLNMVFLDNISPGEKIKTLKQEFDIEVTPQLEKGVSEMCNLSEGIEKRGEARGEIKNMITVAKNMINKRKYSPEEISEISGLPLEKVMDLIDGKTA